MQGSGYRFAAQGTCANSFDTISIIPEALGCFCAVPAMDDHGPSIRKFSLFSVHLSEEAENATWLLRDAMVRPAEVLVVPHFATNCLLRKINQNILK